MVRTTDMVVRNRRNVFCTGLLATTVFALPAIAQVPACVEPDAGGTVVLPPPGCAYVSPQEVHMIIAGLPPGTTIEVGVEHMKFFQINEFPGGFFREVWKTRDLPRPLF